MRISLFSFLLRTVPLCFLLSNTACREQQKFIPGASEYKDSAKPNGAVQLKTAFGINAFEWDFEEESNPLVINENKIKAIRNFSAVRHYMDWEKLEAREGNYTFNPTDSGGWNYDVIYERCKMEGIEVVACLKTLPGWMLNTYPADQRDYENVPLRYGKNFSEPQSYIEQAKVAFQFAARYGNNKDLADSLVRVSRQTNTVKVGLNVIRYIECDNERDKWWKGRKARQTPSEYAANLSAFYDGHKNTMGSGVGVKNADPKMQVVMAGLARPDPGFVLKMIDWCRQHRGYKADGTVDLCWDVINYHYYSNDSETSQEGKATRGIAPELSSAEETAEAFLSLAHQHAGGMPVWVTEAGYDINQASPFKAIAVGQKTVLETQADWILRTALLYNRKGIDKVFFYQLYDDKPGNPLQFSTSGLMNRDQTPRPAAAYLKQVADLFGNAVHKGTVSRNPLVDQYELNGKPVFVLLVPDEKGRSKTFALKLGNATEAYLYSPEPAKGTMSKKKVRTVNGTIDVVATETPVFVTTQDQVYK